MRLRNIIIDFFIVAMIAALLLYLALQSVAGAKYAGAGFQYGNQGLVETALLLIIFALAMFQLVVDLRGR